jgi:hypothetical protein
VRSFSLLVMTDSPTGEQSNPRTGKPSAFPPGLPYTVFATVVMGQYPATVSERLRQGSKMVSSADLRRPCTKRPLGIGWHFTAISAPPAGPAPSLPRHAAAISRSQRLVLGGLHATIGWTVSDFRPDHDHRHCRCVNIRSSTPRSCCRFAFCILQSSGKGTTVAGMPHPGSDYRSRTWSR